jgi:dTDP-D-glucose 4,6-dehydratase
MALIYFLTLPKNHNLENFVQISTDEVYGSIEEGSFRESDSPQPSSPYSASKATGDLMTTAFSRTFGMPVTRNEKLEQLWTLPVPRKVHTKNDNSGTS